ncbi:hypothetical protein PLANPX_0711 [Lacipirellula parvula]|uniref:Uncharacterized protein n=1 Tax=Lacipirellula parvula TaxID=2650471 RepID=A0A5K7XDJ8_9BACT|nr:hypothetical protein PLANPX_0711 [Lacipirellula parvula]
MKLWDIPKGSAGGRYSQGWSNANSSTAAPNLFRRLLTELFSNGHLRIGSYFYHLIASIL